MSRRRLVFTEHQVYFECMSMNCQDSIVKPLKFLHTRDLQTFIYTCHRLRVFPSVGVGNKAAAILDCIREHSKRFLTYDSDALSAFMGMFRSFEDSQFNVSNFWGFPVFPNVEFVPLLPALLWISYCRIQNQERSSSIIEQILNLPLA